MMQVQFAGTVGKDPELRFTASGIAVASFSVAVTKRVKDGDGWKDGPTSWVRCTAWRQMAENVAESVGKGTRVIVSGQMSEREYDKDGVKHRTWDCQVDDIGPSLKFAQASVRRIERERREVPEDDVWANPQQPDEAPF